MSWLFDNIFFINEASLFALQFIISKEHLPELSNATTSASWLPSELIIEIVSPAKVSKPISPCAYAT